MIDVLCSRRAYSVSDSNAVVTYAQIQGSSHRFVRCESAIVLIRLLLPVFSIGINTNRTLISTKGFIHTFSNA